MTLTEVKEFLKDTTRYELRDHAFGDREVYWEKDGHVVADGYFSGNTARAGIVDGECFEGAEAKELLKCGTLKIERNDETGPDEYEDGKIMPGLTLEGVRKELTGEK